MTHVTHACYFLHKIPFKIIKKIKTKKNKKKNKKEVEKYFGHPLLVRKVVEPSLNLKEDY